MARLRLVAVQREQVRRISTAAAHAEGFADRGAFLAAWRRIHGPTADLRAPVWVLTFDVLQQQEAA